MTKRTSPSSPRQTALTYGIWDTRHWETGSEIHHILLEIGDELRRLARTRLVCFGEVFQQLGPGLLLGGEGDLDDSMKELGDLLLQIDVSS